MKEERAKIEENVASGHPFGRKKSRGDTVVVNFPFFSLAEGVNHIGKQLVRELGWHCSLFFRKILMAPAVTVETSLFWRWSL